MHHSWEPQGSHNAASFHAAPLAERGDACRRAAPCTRQAWRRSFSARQAAACAQQPLHIRQCLVRSCTHSRQQHDACRLPGCGRQDQKSTQGAHPRCARHIPAPGMEGMPAVSMQCSRVFLHAKRTNSTFLRWWPLGVARPARALSVWPPIMCANCSAHVVRMVCLCEHILMCACVCARAYTPICVRVSCSCVDRYTCVQAPSSLRSFAAT